jgi:hypothetical protein
MLYILALLSRAKQLCPRMWINGTEFDWSTKEIAA